MKKRHDVDELAKQLTTAAVTPLQKIVQPAPTPEVVAAPAPVAAKKKAKNTAVPVFLRLPATMYQHFDNIAVTRTKKTGRGVSVQQVIIEQLESIQ
jgi:hypothetical protein